jgi:hypothetical protein
MSCTATNCPDIFPATGDDSYQYTFQVLGSYSTVRVRVRANGEDDYVYQTEGEDYTHNANNRTITFLSGSVPEAGGTVRIERCTDLNRLVDFIGGSTLTEANLDNDADRLTSATQELACQLSTTLQQSPGGTCWDAGGLPLCNVGAGTEPTDGVNLQQVINILNGAETAEISNNSSIFSFTGDGITTEFELNGEQELSAVRVLVFVDGVYQDAETAGGPAFTILNAEDSDYPSDGDGDSYLSFTAAPLEDANVEVRVIKGLVSVTFDSASLDGDNIANDSIGLEHLGFANDALSDESMIFVQPDGTPELRVVSYEDIPDFDDGVKAIHWNEMLWPETPVYMFGQQVKNMGAGTAAGDALRKDQIEGLIEDSVQQESGTIDPADMPAAPNTTGPTIEVGFACKRFALYAYVTNGDGNFGFTFETIFSGNEENLVCNATGGTFLRFERDGNDVIVKTGATLAALGSWSKLRWHAQK